MELNEVVLVLISRHPLGFNNESRPSIDSKEVIILASGGRLGSLLGPIDSSYLLAGVSFLILHESIGIPIIIDVDFIN
jgi:hypothetical protein